MNTFNLETLHGTKKTKVMSGEQKLHNYLNLKHQPRHRANLKPVRILKAARYEQSTPQTFHLQFRNSFVIKSLINEKKRLHSDTKQAAHKELSA